MCDSCALIYVLKMGINSYLKDENKGYPLIIFDMLRYAFCDTLTVVLMLLSMIAIVVELQRRRDTRKCNVYTSNAQHCASHEIRAVHPAICIKSFNGNVPVKIPIKSYTYKKQGKFSRYKYNNLSIKYPLYHKSIQPYFQ